MFVSVIVPCYNHEPYLKDRLESIVNQTYQNFELILLDDLSPDNSAEILLSYQNHPKVSHCIINEKNSGSTFHQWNKGISLAKGELIWIAESDDVADLTFLEELVPQFEKNPNLTLAYSQSYRMDAKGVVTGDWKDYTDDINPEKFKTDFTTLGIEYIKKYLIQKNTIPNASAVIFKKERYLKVGGACNDLKITGDWMLWSQILAEGEIYFSVNCLNFFRFHKDSVIAKSKNNANHFIIRNEVISFRKKIGEYWKEYKKINSHTNNLYSMNKKYLAKEINQNTSLAIRKRYYKDIIPTTIETFKATHFYLIPFIVIKLTLKLIYSLLIDGPVKFMKLKIKNH